jgi:TonB family protein
VAKPADKALPVTASPKPDASKASASSASAAGTASKSGAAGTASEFGWYHDLIHDRFFSQWEQPTSIFEQDKSFVCTVRVQIKKDGSISSAEIVRSSGNPLMDQSVLDALKRVSRIDPPPAGLGTADGYTVSINFELQ